MPFTKYGLRELFLFGFAIPAALWVGVWSLAWFVHPALWVVGVVPLFLTCFVCNFFRDPDRPLPGDEFTVVSPADGTVTDVGPKNLDEYLKGSHQGVGIFLSVFDVHVNRSPLDGTLEYSRHQDGDYLDARDPECSTLNEAQNLGFKSSWGPAFLSAPDYRVDCAPDCLPDQGRRCRQARRTLWHVEVRQPHRAVFRPGF
ncbi:MAG: phosphatidylserine decarboxylase [Planctomycetes bacterium]|nr:phosphatidylserine decarboxylase [Planctomycetota bacterium]